MTKIAPQILFALLLLLSQTALVSHDVQHLGNVHGELCAVYVSQDHSADNVIACDQPSLQFFQQSLSLNISDVIEPAPSSAYASRAPPEAILFS